MRKGEPYTLHDLELYSISIEVEGVYLYAQCL